jgi:septation ring formation regulator EzrA
MKCIQAFLLTAALAAPLASASTTANPLNKVLELMDDLAAKITKEGEVEEKAYKEYVEWCDDAATNTKFEIKTATSSKEKLEAAIAQATGDIEVCEGKIESLASGIATDDAQLKDATGIREKESADFLAGEKELMETIDTISRAIAIIEREMAKNPASFAQVDASNMKNLVSALSTIVDAASFSGADNKRLAAFVQAQQSSEDEEFGAPAAAAYKSKSSGIVDVLEDLKEKGEEQLASLRKAETEAQHNFNMVKQSLEDSIAADTKEMDAEKATKASTEEAKATATGDLEVTVKDLANAKAKLEAANTNCMQIAADHEQTVADRTAELKVIAEAKKILSESTGGAADQTYSLLQVRSALSSHADLAKVEVVTLVKRLAKQHHSAALAQLASRISAIMRFGASAGNADVFGKVKGLISDMIAKLEKEAAGEATEKAYCDEQMTKTQAKSDDLSADLSSLSAKIDKATSASAALKQTVKEVEAELATLTKEQAEMDKIRQETSAEYRQAKSDLEAGLTGVRKALSVLREYYGGAALLQGGGSLADQMQQPAMPETHSKATGAGQGIVGILEVVESDFAKNLAAEEAEEADAQSAYEKTTQENAVTKTMKEQDVKYSTKEYKSLDKTVSELSADRENTDTELAAVTEYFDKIKARCIAKPEAYATRAQRREAEIDGLKQALSILEDETAFVQRSKKGRSHHFLGTF